MSLTVGTPRCKPAGHLFRGQRLELGPQLLDLVLLAQGVGTEAEVAEQLPGGLVAFGMDPGQIERIVAALDLEEAGRLGEAPVADAGHLHQLLAILEGAVALAERDQVAGHHAVQAGDVAQQRHAGGVEVDADVVDARFDHAFERFLELPVVDVVLVQADADVLRLDFHQLAQRVLQAPANGDGAAQGGVEVREFLAALGAGGVNAGARFVDDDVGQFRQGVGQLGEDLGMRWARRRGRWRWRSRRGRDRGASASVSGRSRAPEASAEPETCSNRRRAGSVSDRRRCSRRPEVACQQSGGKPGASAPER